MTLPRRATAAVLSALLLTACADGAADTGDGALEVVAGFYPYAFLAERVGGPDVEVSSLAGPGAEPHDLELTPQQVGRLGEADLVVHAEGFQPALDDALSDVADDARFDVHSAVELVDGYVPLEDGELEPEEAGADPHVWLDPTRYAAIATALGARLGELDPDRADAFAERAEALVDELQGLDAELREGLSSCARQEVVTSHNAFGYLTSRYGLEQIAVTGLVPEEEPTPRRLAEVAALAEERGVTTVFFEELVSPRTAESLAREVGATAQVLSPLESAPEDGDYFTAMRTNLATLRTALGCT